MASADGEVLTDASFRVNWLPIVGGLWAFFGGEAMRLCISVVSGNTKVFLKKTLGWLKRVHTQVRSSTSSFCRVFSC